MEKKMVDARGLACPLPVVNAKKAVGEFTQDGELTVLVDNEIAVQNLQKFASQRGMEAFGEKKAEKEKCEVHSHFENCFGSFSRNLE